MAIIRFIIIINILIALLFSGTILAQKPEKKVNYPKLYWLILKGDVDNAKKLVEQGADVNAKFDDNYTLLHAAAWEGEAEFLKLIINNKAKINVIDSEGASPLHDASMNGQYEIVEILLKHGAKVNLIDNEKKTPLHRATYWGNSKIAKLLIDHNALVSLKDEEGKTAFHNVSTNDKYYWIACYLLEKGAIANVKNNKGETPLDISIKNKCERLIVLYKKYQKIK